MIDPELTQRLSKIENIVALKDNSPNAADYALKAALIDPDDMILLNGLGELHYFGSAACRSHYRGFATYIGNFAPSISYEIYETVISGKIDRAKEVLKEKILPIHRLVGKFMKKREDISIIPSVLRTNYMYMSVGKACMNLAGLHGDPLRQPLENLTEEEKEELKRTLEEIVVI